MNREKHLFEVTVLYYSRTEHRHLEYVTEQAAETSTQAITNTIEHLMNFNPPQADYLNVVAMGVKLIPNPAF